MKIQLNKNSWHFKYYSTIIQDTPPKTLCPYFWSMVGLIVVSPFFLPFMLGSKIGSMLPKKKKTPKKSIYDMTNEEVKKELEMMKKRQRRSEIVGKISMIFMIIFLLSIVGVCLYLGAQKVGWFNIVRNTLACIGLIVVVYSVFSLLIKNNVGTKIGKFISKGLNSNVIRIPVEMIKSVYKKACPLIDWN